MKVHSLIDFSTANIGPDFLTFFFWFPQSFSGERTETKKCVSFFLSLQKYEGTTLKKPRKFGPESADCVKFLKQKLSTVPKESTDTYLVDSFCIQKVNECLSQLKICFSLPDLITANPFK